MEKYSEDINTKLTSNKNGFPVGFPLASGFTIPWLPAHLDNFGASIPHVQLLGVLAEMWHFDIHIEIFHDQSK